MSNDSDQLVSPPKSTDSAKVTQLGYIHSYDGVVDKDYAYVAYKEENPRGWRLKILGKVTAGTAIDPSHPSFRSNMAAAARKGEDHILIGFSMTPKSDDDPRLVQNRVFFDEDLVPSHVEMHLVTRKASGKPTELQVVRFDWPG
jgi:hypothetical protein